MTPEVVELLRSLIANIEPFPRIALLSPGSNEKKLFPRAAVLGREDWDLNQPRRDLRFDLIIACHVFHYSSEPIRWLENVGASCRALLIADLIRRQRSAQGELGQDGDAMRYAVDAHRPTVSPHFELNSLGERLLARHVFAGAPNEYGPALHVLALIQGALDGPLIHLSGLDASAARPVIGELETRSLPAYLGLSPTLLEPALVEYLRSLRFVSPALQNPKPKRSSILPSWVGAKRVHERLRSSHSELEKQLGRKVSTYLARGRVDRGTQRVLAGLGFDLCLGDRRPRRAVLPSLASDFSGSARDYPTGRALEVVGLSLASEGKPEGGGLNGMFESIEEQRRASRDRIRQLAVRVAAL